MPLKSRVKMRPDSCILYLRDTTTVYLRQWVPEPPRWRAWIIGALKGSDDTASLRFHVYKWCPTWELVAYRFSGQRRIVKLGEITQTDVDAAEAALPG